MLNEANGEEALITVLLMRRRLWRFLQTAASKGRQSMVRTSTALSSPNLSECTQKKRKKLLRCYFSFQALVLLNLFQKYLHFRHLLCLGTTPEAHAACYQARLVPMTP